MDTKETPHGLFIKVFDKYTNRKFWFDPEKYRNKIMPFEIMKIIGQYTYYISLKTDTLRYFDQVDYVLAIIPHRKIANKNINLLLFDFQKKNVVHADTCICKCQDLDNMATAVYQSIELGDQTYSDGGCCCQILIHLGAEGVLYVDNRCIKLTYYQLWPK